MNVRGLAHFYVGAEVGFGAAAQGEAAQEESRFTEEDYSNYSPEDSGSQEAVQEPAATSEVLLEQSVADEDQLYDE